ncbi:hypothetical protein OQA88_4487 [Cercophora sp. LCS_1]
MPSAEAPADIHKRKREADDGHADRIPQPPPPQTGNGPPINYLSRTGAQPRLPLIQGDSEIFSDVLSLLSDYEGILSRHESLAANLGAKLTAPRLLRAMEGLFEGGINATPTVSPQSPFRDRVASSWQPPSWLEIVGFAKSNPADFTLTTAGDGRRVCRFVMTGSHVEITEDDWRLIMSGTLDRFPLAPAQPLDEDETAELATLDILEQRIQVLIKQADEVARKARQLNYHLSGRKAGINSRRANVGFQPVNQAPPVRTGGLHLGYDLHADLLQQFLTTPQPTATVVSRPPSITSSLPTPSEVPRLRPIAAISTSHAPSQSSNRPSPVQPSAESPTLRESAAAASSDNTPSSHHVPLITLISSRIEKLSRGDPINPPCDRCRRLKTTCLKHLTSCQGCTRKHAKCSWKSLTEDEVAVIRGDSSTRGARSTSADEERNDANANDNDNPPPPYHQQVAVETAEVTEGARVLRELSGRHRIGFTPTPTTPGEPRPSSRNGGPAGSSGGGAELSRMLQAEHMDVDHPTPSVESVKKDNKLGSLRDSFPGQHSQHLLFMANMATAAADARAGGRGPSRGSSAGQD